MPANPDPQKESEPPPADTIVRLSEACRMASSRQSIACLLRLSVFRLPTPLAQRYFSAKTQRSRYHKEPYREPGEYSSLQDYRGHSF
jgi:hypothetical protein